MFKQIALSAALLAAPAALLAQSQPAATPAAGQANQAAPALTPQQLAAIKQQNEAMAQGAARVAQMIDQGQAGQVWDGASSGTKQVVARDSFVKQIAADRAQVGKLVSRKLAAISRSQSTDGRAPAGIYINVSFATQFANEKQPVRELISFHLDSDKTWRVSGYTLR
ncbi:DUF4019 domain-containing protein [Rhodanobacter sp. DHG33]|uniref:DUF4019 domain-containing protein n=1 Tax=Rhodanobacter sp. DHG33 TaxID=2775921 RepID=UPI00177C04F6|nr:DUF4019 domain-containing protein [Rhodanobacter sp. DHG33]MBD8899769.1 DUF4019 domain-containing protein [Rhodanobacter sp. DHG33]